MAVLKPLPRLAKLTPVFNNLGLSRMYHVEYGISLISVK
ncbi:hypothetical protein THF1C08_20373 [Vibrio jasicida]|uniref:Uncharacterized protein n=1 Tax=Vibrio jasicida TaxID=766224 RepID=A0AAU9QN22_9VIBR|nr:hypothetical protein THF1C08_20373 [Vibrio jasicida]CAH1587285.1 hypothetical protein THF1A12_20375 [Vibrio jasicida]